MSEFKDFKLVINQEGTPGHRWHLWDEDALRLSSTSEYMRIEDAIVAARKFVLDVNAYGFVIDDADVYAKYEPNMAHILNYGGWGYAGILTGNGPLSTVALTTFYATYDEACDFLQDVMLSTLRISNPEDVEVDVNYENEYEDWSEYDDEE